MAEVDFNNTSATAAEAMMAEHVTKGNVDHYLTLAVNGTRMRRIKFGKTRPPRVVQLSPDHSKIHYTGQIKCFPNKLKFLKTSEILEVRAGWNSDNFARLMKNMKFQESYPQNRCFSVVLRHAVLLQKVLDFIAETPEEQKAWVAVLHFLTVERRVEVLRANEDKWIAEKFEKADVDKNGKLAFPEVFALLDNMGVEVSERYAKKLFDKANTEKGGRFEEATLNPNEFAAFCKELSKRPEIASVMEWYSSAKSSLLTASDLKDFLEKEQELRLSLEECEQLIRKHEPCDRNRSDGMLSELGFHHLLLDPNVGLILNSKDNNVWHDMSKPLPNYFICSSHNTYLMGNQLRGEATVEGYVTTLSKGVKCVELDVWSGNPEPIVTHGHTLVKPISLRSAAEAISAYAFAMNDFPLILSIENHCSVDQQRIMAAIFKTVFGWGTTGDGTMARPVHEYSPHELRGKILIRSKKLPPSTRPSLDILESVSESVSENLPPPNEDGEYVTESDDTDEDEVEAEEGSPMKELQTQNESSTESGSKKKTPMKMSREFSDCVVVKNNKVHHPAGLDLDSLSTQRQAFSSFSWSESKFEKYSHSMLEEVVKTSSKLMMRTYPKGIRTGSSNYMPVRYWFTGAQIVALNMQTPGDETDVYRGFFRMNGGCGYVLKPDYLREAKPRTEQYFETAPYHMTLHIEVISGNCLPKPSTTKVSSDIVDPYVSLEVFGLKCDEQKEKTSVIRNNGFHPVWNEKFTFHIKCPDFAILRFAVKDYDMTSYNDFVGEYSLPVNCIAPGYRRVKLNTGYDRVEDPIATLFVKIRVKKMDDHPSQSIRM